MNIEKDQEKETIIEGVGTLVLSKPIDINGEKTNELKYNFDDMTARDKQKAGLAFKKAGGGVSVQELDSDYHLYLFASAVAKENQSIDINDILRISAKDAAKAEALVRDFFFLGSME
jgi:hypothetical protein